MRKLLFIGIFIFLHSTYAREVKIVLPPSPNQFKIINQQDTFTQIHFNGMASTKHLGEPELPVKSFLLKGVPQEIFVAIHIDKKETLSNIKPWPVQKQKCRCDVSEKNTFLYDKTSYKKQKTLFQLTYLGAFRGQPITRLDIPLAQYQPVDNSLVLLKEVTAQISAEEYSFVTADYKDFLILASQGQEDELEDFINWKRQKGFQVKVEWLTEPQKTLPVITQLIRDHYNQGADFVMIVGDQNTIPMHLVPTSGSYQTPSDLNYFTMDGEGDHIPDLFYSRIVTSPNTSVKDILAKSIAFEKKSQSPSSAFQRIIGIASNEGSNPPDNEYITSIKDKFMDQLKVSPVHLYQNDKSSNPAFLNQSFDDGAFWLTYMGHGDGHSWPNMNQRYRVSAISDMHNKAVMQPIIIDIACQNGALLPGWLGSSFLSGNNISGIGAVAYYGGSVNISWHPPAIMAQGIAFEHMDKNFHYLGEALMAGQLYLAQKWNNKEDLVDNWEWFHLQGDPSLGVHY